MIASSRLLILIAVVCAFLAATMLLVYGAFDTYTILVHIFAQPSGEKVSKQLILDCIELVDLLLLATVLYITAIGLYELFIDPDVPMPEWLVITTLDDLKNKLTAVVIVVLGVIFLGQVVSWNGQTNLLPYGAAIALMIVALTYFLSQKVKGKT